MEAEEPAKEPSALGKLRNMWEFASLMQYIFLFGKVVKIDEDLDIEELESECLKPQPSEKLSQIGLALLKFVSSHKGLTPEIFDEYTRRQYVAKAPKRNPFGTDETPNKFDEFDVFTKIRVLQQLSTWTFHNPDRIRERMAETDAEQTNWRMEAFGWDSQDRTYFVLDDDRLYRRTDPPLPSTPSKAKSKARPKKGKARRGNKRRKLSTPTPDSPGDDEEDTIIEHEESQDDGLGGMKWECLCITMEEYRNFLDIIRRSKDPNEKAMFQRLEKDVIPIIAGKVEEQLRKEARRQKELEVLQKLATAKRSSRISAKMEKQKEIEEAAETQRKRQAELSMAKKEQERQRKMEEARESRMMTREQRLKEREVKRILHEEELKKLEEDSKRLDQNEARLSERHLKAEMQRRQQELEKLAEEEDWVFDCSVCGLHGENLDDGSHSIACEKCNVWQHSKCHGITVAEAEREDFHFLCRDCKRRIEETKLPKLPPLKFRLNASASPNSGGAERFHHVEANGGAISTPKFTTPRQADSVQIPVPPRASNQSPLLTQSLMNGPSLSPRGQALGPPGIQRSEAAYGLHQNGLNGMPPVLQARPYSSSQPSGSPVANGLAASTPPQWQIPQGTSPLGHNQNPISYPQFNGGPYTATNPSPRGILHDPFANSFNHQRPPSASPSIGVPSPVKRAPSMSPQQTNGRPASFMFATSPNSSFPPSSAQRPSYSPTKQSSPSIRRSPVPISPVPVPISPAQILPAAASGISPEKHDGVRPVSSHSVSETPVLPPVKSLSPSANPPIMSPPSKKMTPERPQTNGFGGAY